MSANCSKYVDCRRSCSHGNILFDLQCIKRLLTHPVFSVDVCTKFQQKFNNRLLSVPTGKMKRGQEKLPKIGENKVVRWRRKKPASSVYNDGLAKYTVIRLIFTTKLRIKPKRLDFILFSLSETNKVEHSN